MSERTPAQIRKEKFALKFIETNNATASAIYAGYSEKTAHSQGCRLLKDVKVKEIIEGAKKETRENHYITREKILEELGRIAFGNLAEFMTYTADGQIVFKPSDQLTEEQQRQVAEFSTTTKVDPTGGIVANDAKIKMHDKMKALDMINRMLGNYNDNVTVTKKIINVTLDEEDEE